MRAKISDKTGIKTAAMSEAKPIGRIAMSGTRTLLELPLAAGLDAKLDIPGEPYQEELLRGGPGTRVRAAG